MKQSYDQIRLIFHAKASDQPLECKLIDLPVDESVMIKKSMEFFHDPAPCMIHRSAVLNRLYAELLDFCESAAQPLENLGAGLPWRWLPPDQQAWFDLSGSACPDYILIKRIG
ncbi:MAG: hypothetical protein VB070_11380 [Clostridiaceae bacterium]|nr:hypothetical protein [Clostridiaceae bacterium]